MSKATGFKTIERIDLTYRDVETRKGDYNDVAVRPSLEGIKTQSTRCMDCGIPFCHSIGCPLGNLIPEWNDLIYAGRWKDAYARLELTNNLPEVTGKVCPAPCESACTLAKDSSPVTICNVENSIIEKAFEEGWVVPRKPEIETGKKVAVIGSGPAGLAAAQELRRKGHAVTVYEKDARLGGFLRYGIPDFKLEKWVLDRREEQYVAEGIEIKTNVNVGVDITVEELKAQYDVVLLALGARAPRDLPVPGRDLDGVHFAVEYLKQSNEFVSGDRKLEDRLTAEGKNVLVIGGGDTGSDCVGTANRQGAKKVYQFEIMPKPLINDKESNPEWPRFTRTYLKTSSSHKEGCHRDWNIQTNEFIGKDGKLAKGKFSRIEWVPGKDGGRPDLKVIDGEDFELDIDLVLLAAGFLHVEHGPLVKGFGIDLDNRGNIQVNNYATSVDGVFSAGDATTGASLIVNAIAHGRKAATAIDNYLQK